MINTLLKYVDDYDHVNQVSQLSQISLNQSFFQIVRMKLQNTSFIFQFLHSDLGYKRSWKNNDSRYIV